MKKVINALLAALVLSTAVCSAEEEETFNLKMNMLKLNVELGKAREAMVRNEIGSAIRAFKALKTEAHDLLSNQDRIEALLGEERKHQSYLALEAAKRIGESIEIIEDAFGANKNDLSNLKRRVAAQRAYTAIETACFHCHNLVRDK